MEEHQTLGCLHPINSREVLERLLLDQMCPVGTDRTLGCLRPVNSSKVPERVFLDRTCPVGAHQMLVRVRLELKALSDIVVGTTNRSVWSP